MSSRLAVAVACAATLTLSGAHADDSPRTSIRHVLLISVDGLHASDLSRYVAAHPQGALAALGRRGVTYSNASSSRPSDSFPGLVALVSGATPKTSGVYYDDTYDRSLSPPGDLACQARGTETQFAENIDRAYDAVVLGGSTRLDAGGGIDPLALPRDAAHGCTPVYPHQFLRVNTVFSVAARAGLRTAWSDKHPAYELVRGRENAGADDLYTPEINSPPHDLACTAQQGPGGNVDDLCAVLDPNAQWTSDVSYTVAYDGLKVQAVVNEIHGLDHAGREQRGVPAIFGMNFQSVSVAQKLTAGGYVDAAGTPSAPLATALDFVDASLGRMKSALEAEHLLDSTLVVIAAKHGQSPIDVATLHMLTGSKNPKAIADVTDVTDVVGPVAGIAQATEDDVSLLWLSDHAYTGAAAAALTTAQGAAAARVQTVYSGEALEEEFGDPERDPRAPDLIVQPVPGTIYSKSKKKIAEHGGFAPDDTHVALLLSNPRLEPATVDVPVTNRQVAPTILAALHLPLGALDAVRVEHVRPLPRLDIR